MQQHITNTGNTGNTGNSMCAMTSRPSKATHNRSIGASCKEDAKRWRAVAPGVDVKPAEVLAGSRAKPVPEGA